MTADALLAELEAAGVLLRRDGDRMRYLAPPGALTPAWRDRIRAQRAELLARLPDAPAATVWWTDPSAAPPAADPWLRAPRHVYAAIRAVPPRDCLAPVACSRLGPCSRRRTGWPCLSNAASAAPVDPLAGRQTARQPLPTGLAAATARAAVGKVPRTGSQR